MTNAQTARNIFVSTSYRTHQILFRICQDIKLVPWTTKHVWKKKRYVGGGDTMIKKEMPMDDYDMWVCLLAGSFVCWTDFFLLFLLLCRLSSYLEFTRRVFDCVQKPWKVHCNGREHAIKWQIYCWHRHQTFLATLTFEFWICFLIYFRPVSIYRIYSVFSFYFE